MDNWIEILIAKLPYTQKQYVILSTLQ